MVLLLHDLDFGMRSLFCRRDYLPGDSLKDINFASTLEGHSRVYKLIAAILSVVRPGTDPGKLAAHFLATETQCPILTTIPSNECTLFRKDTKGTDLKEIGESVLTSAECARFLLFVAPIKK